MVRAHIFRLILVAAFSVSQFAPTAARAEVPVASSASVDPNYAPLVDSVEADYLRSTADLTHYEVVAELSPVDGQSNASITGKSAITYTNHTGAPLTEIYLRLYPNSAEYAEGGMIVSGIRVDGHKATGKLGQDDTLLTIVLPSPAAEDASIRLSFRFETTIPTDPRRSYGMFKYDSGADTYSLAHWQPLLAGWDRVHGWNTAPVSKNGDPVFTEAAVFDVTLTAPSNLVFATSGSVLKADGATAHYASGPSRDFVMAASSNFVVTEEVVGETTVRSFAWSGSGEGSQRVLDSGAKSLELYSNLIGLYPYEELDLVQVDIGNGAGGVEFPGMVFIGSSFYDLASGIVDPEFLEFVVVHEVAHQWFYNVVGNNQYEHAFMDESLANDLSIVYFADEYGAEEANKQANLNLRLGYFDLLFQQGDQVVDQPTDDFPSEHAYGVVVYGKGALAFMELRREIGADAFFAGLRQYYRDFAFQVAEPEDMKAAFEAASGQDLTDFWTHWFDQADGADDFDATDLARLLREIGE